MLQAANTGILNPLVPKAHNSESKSTISLQIKPAKVTLKLIGGFFIFCTLGTNGLSHLQFWKANYLSIQLENLTRIEAKALAEASCDHSQATSSFRGVRTSAYISEIPPQLLWGWGGWGGGGAGCNRPRSD